MQQFVVSKSKVRSLYKMFKTSENTPQKNLMAQRIHVRGKLRCRSCPITFFYVKIWLISLQKWVCISLPCFKNVVNASKQLDVLSEFKILP